MIDENSSVQAEHGEFGKFAVKYIDKIGLVWYNIQSTEICYGVWLSSVERLVRDQEAAGSNPVTPTKKKTRQG